MGSRRIVPKMKMVWIRCYLSMRTVRLLEQDSRGLHRFPRSRGAVHRNFSSPRNLAERGRLKRVANRRGPIRSARNFDGPTQ